MGIATYFEHDPPLSPRSRNRRPGTTKDAGARPVGHRASCRQPGGGRRAVRGRRRTPLAFPAGEECPIGRRRGPKRNDEAVPRAPTQCRRSDVAKILHDITSRNETPNRNERNGPAAGATPDRRPLASLGRWGSMPQAGHIAASKSPRRLLGKTMDFWKPPTVKELVGTIPDDHGGRCLLCESTCARVSICDGD